MAGTDPRFDEGGFRAAINFAPGTSSFVSQSCKNCGDDLIAGKGVGIPLQLCSKECRAAWRARCGKPPQKREKTGNPIGRPGRKIDIQSANQRHQQGESISHIAKTMGVTRSRLVEKFDNLSIPIRKGSWGENHQRWKGGRYVNPHGYVILTLARDDEYVGMANMIRQLSEHRYLMAKFLGRALESHETVHHIDGNRSNNDLDNLQLRFGDHGEGVILECGDCGSHNVLPEELPCL